jgi:hypothetical protein
MAAGIGSYLADKLLDAACRGESVSVSAVYVQLHVGSPGAVGMLNTAIETTRKPCTFASASNGITASDVDVTWVNVAGSETVSFFTAWDGLTDGNFLFSGGVTADGYIAGDTFTIGSGQLFASLRVAS